MKDELGIEMCGKNCFCHNKNCPLDCATCTRWKPKSAAYKARIRELQDDKDYLERVAKYHADLGGASLADLLNNYSELDVRFKVLTKLLEKKSFELDELQVRVQLAERKEICAKENAEKLDATESEPKACDDCWLMRDFGRYIPAGYCANGKCAKIYNAFATESEVRK